MRNIICFIFKHKWKSIFWSYSFEHGNVSSIECDQCERCDTLRVEHKMRVVKWGLNE